MKSMLVVPIVVAVTSTASAAGAETNLPAALSDETVECRECHAG